MKNLILIIGTRKKRILLHQMIIILALGLLACNRQETSGQTEKTPVQSKSTDKTISTSTQKSSEGTSDTSAKKSSEETGSTSGQKELDPSNPRYSWDAYKKSSPEDQEKYTKDEVKLTKLKTLVILFISLLPKDDEMYTSRVAYLKEGKEPVEGRAKSNVYIQSQIFVASDKVNNILDRKSWGHSEITWSKSFKLLEAAHTYAWNEEVDNPEIEYFMTYYPDRDGKDMYSNRPLIWVYPFIREWFEDDGDQVIKHTMEITPEGFDLHDESIKVGNIKVSDTYTVKFKDGPARYKEESIWILDSSNNLLMLDKYLWSKKGMGYQLDGAWHTIRADG